MKQLLKNHKTYMMLLLSLMYSKIIFGQNLTMSSVSNLKNNSSLSSPIVFKSSAACIDVQSGIAVFNSFKGFGEFEVNCEVKENFNTLGIKMFPNPVKTICNLKFVKIPPLKDYFNITIWNMEGVFVKSRKETGLTIFEGFEIDLTNLTPGSYILKIESSKYLEAIKFIKVN